MGKSQRIRSNDMRRVFELVHEITDRGGNSTAWRSHMLVGAKTLLESQLGLTLDVRNALPGTLPALIDPITLGWNSPRDEATFYNYFESDVVEDPGAIAIVGRHLSTQFLTGSRRQWIDDKTWYASPTVSEARRAGGVDEFLSSTVRLEPGLMQGFIFYRPIGDRPYEDRDRKLLRLCHLSILRHYRQGLSRQALHDRLAVLSPRVRQTLDQLLQGHDLKTIGRRMGISRHTVNDYTKVLHKHFNVSSRAEPMQNFVTPPQAPLLALPAGMPRIGLGSQWKRGV